MAGTQRRERRKEARLGNNKKKFDAWLQYNQSKKLKKSQKSKKPFLDNAVKFPINSNANEEFDLFETESHGLVEKNRPNVDNSDGKHSTVMKSKRKTKSLRREKGSTKSTENNFTKYLKMETEGNDLLAQEDLMFERRLAKKLKVKKGRLTAANDDLDAFLDGIPSVLDSLGESEEDHKISDIGAVSGQSRKRELADEATDDEISGDEDDEISNDEESDSLVASSEESDDVVEDLPKDSKKVKRKKTKFEEYLENSTGNGDNMVEADLQLERKLAKKLKLNKKDIPGEDGMDMLLDGIPSALDSKSVSCAKLSESNPPEREQKPQKKINSNTGAYVAPHLRSGGGNESEEHAQVRRRIRGLLNRLSESNVESVTSEIAELYHSVGRSIGSEIISEEVVSSCARGPRGNEQYAAVLGAFVAGMTCLVGVDFGAKLLASIAKCFEEEYMKEDNLSLRNLTLLLSFVYIFGVCSSELMYDFLIMLSKRLTEVDVSTVLTVLQCCGMNLRGDDPVGMKNFILSVQSRVNEMKASSEDGQSVKISKRMEFMLETICDIKNNKKKAREDTAQHTRVKKWLQKLRVDNILISGLNWSKLLDPTMKGQWWLSGDMASSQSENIEDVSVKIDKEVPETKKMLQLAAAQRMNTSARRAIFCVIMSGEDYIDAFEKLLRLELTGKQDREIMRVLVDCCLREKIFNKYYCVLANKLCSHDKNHKFTLQYCLWDHFKELESMPLIRSMHLAKFVAEMIASFSISLAVLKAVDLNDPSQLTAKRIMHFRLIFEGIFEFPDKVVWNIFTRIAINPEYEQLRIGIKFFVTKYVVSTKKALNIKFQIARKALSNADSAIF